jgi:trehalose 6-phosphate phosphatase
MGSSAALAPFRARPADAAVVVDFDGTLSPIVDDPAAARPLPAAPAALQALAQRYALVGVLSGRPVEFLAPLLPPEIAVSGLYGLEVVRDGTRVDHPFAGAWREVIEDVARCSVSLGPDGMQVEPKGLSLTLHYRAHPDLADPVHDWAVQQAWRSGLEVRPARMSVELHPPIATDKGTALEALTEGLEGVCYVGDDIGDLPAFDALDRLAEAAAMHTVRVAVRSDEVPPELLDRADLVVDGPTGVLQLLRDLVP